MLVPFLVALAIAGILAVLLFMSKSEASKLKVDRDEKFDQLEKQEVLISDMESTVDTVQSHNALLEEKVSASEKDVLATKKELASKSTLLSEKTADWVKTVEERDALSLQLQEADKRIVDLAARPDVVLNEIAANDSNNANALWELELVRSERAWRNSVATNPVSDESPFIDVEDPVRLAVEVEAAALREDVGAYVTIDWKAEPIEDSARRHLVVRVAQELLAAAAKSPGASKLVISGEDDLKLSFEPVDEDTEINLIPPQIDNDLVEITSEEGLTVTVKS